MKSITVNLEQDYTQLDTVLLTDYVASLGKTVVEQMLNLYIQQSALYLSDIEKAQVMDSSPLWQEHCHKMKGAAGSVGLKSLHAHLQKIEKTTATKLEKRALFEALKTLNKEAVLAFTHWLVTKS
ncbi:MAG: Hpt domain-containing protein [Colwellia sp.]